MPQSHSVHESSRKIFWVILAAACALRLLAAAFSQGYWHPDEHFQVIEPAAGMAQGFWYQTWEWERGIRSWFLPGVFGVLFKGFYAVGIKDALVIAFLSRVLLAFYSLIGLGFFFRLLKALDTDRAAWQATAIFAFFPLFIFLSVRTSNEAIAVVPVVACLYFWSRSFQESHLRSAWLAGILLGIAFCIRFQVALLGPALFLGLFFVRPLGPLPFVFLSGCLLPVVLQGALDYLTWGSWWHSPIEYLRFNLLESGASNYGVAPWHRYVSGMGRLLTIPLGAALLVLWVYWMARSFAQASQTRFKGWLVSPRFWIIFSGFFFVFVHSLISHKEDRFLLPVLPIFLLATVLGLRTFVLPLVSRLVLLLLALASIYLLVELPWNQHYPDIQLARALGKDGRVKGVALLRPHPPGGYFYLGRPVGLERGLKLSELPGLGIQYNAIAGGVPDQMLAYAKKNPNWLNCQLQSQELAWVLCLDKE